MCANVWGGCALSGAMHLTALRTHLRMQGAYYAAERLIRRLRMPNVAAIINNFKAHVHRLTRHAGGRAQEGARGRAEDCGGGGAGAGGAEGAGLIPKNPKL